MKMHDVCHVFAHILASFSLSMSDGHAIMHGAMLVTILMPCEFEIFNEFRSYSSLVPTIFDRTRGTGQGGTHMLYFVRL